MTNSLKIGCASHHDGYGYAWLAQPVEDTTDHCVTYAPDDNYREALGSLLLMLSCIIDLERTGIDITLEDVVPSWVVALVTPYGSGVNTSFMGKLQARMARLVALCRPKT